MKRSCRKNILYTSHFASVTGGGQKSLLLLLEGLNLRKYCPIVFCPHQGELVDVLRRRKVKVLIRRFPPLKLRNIFKAIFSIFTLRNLIIKMNIKIIHTDSSRSTFYLGIISKWLKIPLIYHVRVSAPEPWIYERLLYSLADKVVTVSVGASARFRGLNRFGQKVQVIYNAVKMESFNNLKSENTIRDEIGVNNEVMVGMLGEISPLKGQKDLIMAASEVLKYREDIKFIIMGTGQKEYLRELKKIILNMNLSKQIMIMDYRESIAEVMSSLDILVNASSLEGCCRVIIEAMASGKAVIASDVGGNPESVIHRETGLLYQAHNLRELTAAIVELAGDKKKRDQMGQSGKRRVEKIFSHEMCNRKIDALYKDVRYGKKTHKKSLSFIAKNNLRYFFSLSN